MNKNELDALITLLDDPDQEVHRMVMDKLISCGPGILPDLETVGETVLDPDAHQRLEQVVSAIVFDDTAGRLRQWMDGDRSNLLEPAMLIARFQTPTLDEVKVRAELDRIRKDIWLEMNYNLTPLEQVNVFNHVFYSINGFAANAQNLFDADNNFINKVLETRKGNPVSLGLLYMVLAKELGMPIYGVNLAQHFILSYHNRLLDGTENEMEVRKSLLFYINCLNKGIIFTREDITMFLKRINVDPQPHHYVPCDNLTLVTLLVNNLLHSYEMAGRADKVQTMLKFKDVLKP
jgi:hypothetical protein